MAEKPRSSVLWLTLLVLPIGVNAWKVLALHYSPGELVGNLGFDLVVVGLLILVGMVNPLRWGLIHRGLWVALVGSWLVVSPPEGLWGWFGGLFVAAFLAIVMPHLYSLSGLVVVSLVLAFSIIRVVMPLYALDEVSLTLAKKDPSSAAQAFVGGLANHRVFSLARERARWAVEPGTVSGAEMRRLHRDLWRQLRPLKVYYVHWDRLWGEVVGGRGDETVLRCSGLTAGILHDEKERGPGMQPATTISTGLPTLGLRLGPFEITVRRQKDGTYRVVKAPDHVPIEPVLAR